jgi:3-oxoacyl-[acyl-carrier-protein] synthase-1
MGGGVMAELRVAITGYGCLTAVGADGSANWEAVLSGRSGIKPVKNWDSTGWPMTLAAEIANYQPRKLVPDRKLLKAISRQDVIGLNAVDQAVAHSGILEHRDLLEDVESFNDKTGVFVGSPATRYGNQHDFLMPLSASDRDTRAFGLGAMDEVHPMWLLRALPNNVLAYAGITYGFTGANANLTEHAVSGLQAIAEACRYLRDGVIERAVVVGYDAAPEPEMVAYYASMGLLSRTGLRSFDVDRDGTVLGEGAGALILEERGAAERRGATIYGEVLGSSVVSEASGGLSIREDGDGLIRAIRLALDDCGRPPDAIGMISAHGNGTRVSDASEARAYAEVFGPSAVPVTGFKWCIGHTIAASGVLETVLALLSLREGCVPGVASLQRLAPDCQGLRISASHQEPTSRLGLVVSRGFAGLNSCIVLSVRDRRHSS